MTDDPITAYQLIKQADLLLRQEPLSPEGLRALQGITRHLLGIITVLEDYVKRPDGRE